MSKILGLDVGDIRVGVAIGDTQTRLASMLEAFPRASGRAEKELTRLLKELAVGVVVVGLPLDEQDQETAQSQKVRAFCRRLQKRAKFELIFVDEYGSSLEAEEKMRLTHGKASRNLKKGMIDQLSAVIILETYFSTLENKL